MAEKGKVGTWKTCELNPLCASFEKWPGAVTSALRSKFSLGHLLSWAVWGDLGNISLPVSILRLHAIETNCRCLELGRSQNGQKSPSLWPQKGLMDELLRAVLRAFHHWPENSSMHTVRIAKEAWVPRHLLGRRGGCFDCGFHHYSIQWWGGGVPWCRIGAETLPSLQRFLVRISVNISKLPGNCSYCYNMAKSLLSFL